MRSSRDSTPAKKQALLVWAVCALLLLAVAVVYGQSLSYILLEYDDGVFVVGNPHVNQGLTGEGVHWALTSGPGGEWYPLAMLSHMLDCQLFGLQAWGHHLSSVLLHAATSIALFLVLRSMTGELWPSAFVAAVFAVHPQHVESVAWVSERKDVLSGLLFVLTLAAYLGYTRHGRSLGWYLLLAVTFALGLLAKPMLVTVPPLLLLLDYWPLARLGLPGDRPGWTDALPQPSLLRLVLEKLPLLALAIGDSLITMRTHSSVGVEMPLKVRLANGMVACVAYIGQFFYPVDLVVFYPSLPGGPAMWKVASAGAIVLAVSVVALVWRRRCPYLYVGWFWYLGMLFPTLGFVTVAWFSMADRYMYLPGIGLYVVLAWGATRLAAGFAAARLPLAVSAAAAVIALTACAVKQTSYWRDDETLWNHAMSCTSDNMKAEVAVGCALMGHGQLDQALPIFRRAVEHPLDYTPYMNLGLCLARLGQLPEAMLMFRRAVEIQPDAIDAQCALALALTTANQVEEANQHFQFALQIDPAHVNAHCGYAFLLRRLGKLDEARAEFEKALAIDPRKLPAHLDLASLLMKQGQIDAAIPHLETALAIDPKQLRVQIALARALAARGRTAEAGDHYRQALAIDPNNAAARDELARLER